MAAMGATPEPEPELCGCGYEPRVSVAEAGRRIRLVARSIHGDAPAAELAVPESLPTVKYSREAHMRLLQSQADAARLEATVVRMGGDGGELDVTVQQFVDASARAGRLHDVLTAANRERAAMRELSEIKESIVQRIEQIARDDRSISKLQSELVVKRRELAEYADQMTKMRREAEVAEGVARSAMDAARTTALKLTNHQFSELRSMRKPPKSVLVITEGLVLLLEGLDFKQRQKKNQAPKKQEWNHQKLMLKNPRRLRSRLKSLDVNTLGAKHVETLRTFLDSHDVTLRTVPRLSFVCQALAKYLLAVCSSWQALQDLLASQRQQQLANENYDANTQAITNLEENTEANRERVAALQHDLDKQISLKHDVASAHASAKDKLETAEVVLRDANFVKPICAAVRHRHHKQLQSLLVQDHLSSVAGFFRGSTPLHVAAETNNAPAAAALLQHAGVQLMLQYWYDPVKVFTRLLQRNAGIKKKPVHIKLGCEVQDEEDETLDPGIDRVPLTMIAQLATDVAAPSSSVLELELIQPRLFDLISSGASFEDTGVARSWFEKWWLKARPIRSPLWIAASHGYYETVQVMLAECDKQNAIGRGVSWGPDIVRAWHTAVWRGHIDVVRSFGSLRSLDCMQLLDANQHTALWNAIRLRNISMVQCLSELGCNLSDGGPAAVGEPPLHLAVRLGCGTMVQTLVDAGAEMLATDASGGTPCHTACRAGHDHLVELLYNSIAVDGEPAEVKDHLGRTALDIAVGQKHLLCCAEIIRIRHNRRLHSEWMTRPEKVVASLPRTKSKCTAANGQFLVGDNGWTLLHAATHMGLIDTVKLAIQKSVDREAALKAKARDLSMACSWTPLMLAVLGEDRDPEVLHALISASEASWCGSGIPPVRERNEENWDALWIASNEGHTKLVGMLLRAGADPYHRDAQGINCLMAAALAGQLATSQLLMDVMFVEGSASSDMLATLSTVLFCGLASSDTQLIATVLSLGVDPNKLDAYGQTATEHAVAMNCNIDVLRLLARQGRARLWDPARSPGLPIVIHIDESLDCLHVADSTRTCFVQEFLDTLANSTRQMSEGEPPWLVAIANSYQARNRVTSAKQAQGKRKPRANSNPSSQSKYTKTDAGHQDDIDKTEGECAAQTEQLRFYDAVNFVVTTRNDLLRNADDKVSAVLSGKHAYKLSLHFHVITDVIGAAHAFSKRPSLLKQVCSQIDPLHRTPLHVAAQLGKADWARVLIEAAALREHDRRRVIEATDRFGRNVLHMAVESGSTEIAQCIFLARPNLLEAETKYGQTPREVATTLRRRAQMALAKSRYVECWSRRLVATVSDEALLAMELELELRKEMEDYLRQHFGAASRCRRAIIKAGRWLLLGFALPWFALHTLIATTVLVLLCPTLREGAVVLHNLFAYRRFGAAYGILSSAVATSFWFFGRAGKRELTQSLLLGCTTGALLFQAIVTCRILAECRWQLCRPPTRTTVALFHNGFDLRSMVWVLLLILELPQQAALAYVGATDGWFWMLPLLSPMVFKCIDHSNCVADLRNTTVHGINLHQACEAEFCATCVRAGQCDTACGYCASTILGLKPFELMSYVASAAALAWVCVASVAGISFGLACTGPILSKYLPRIRADIWRIPAQDVWSHFFCHTIYVPVVMTLLRVADCRTSTTQAANATSGLPWIFSDWEASYQWQDDTEIECWSDAHARWLVPSVVLMLAYQLLAGVLPVMLHQPMPYGSITVVVPYTFDGVSRFVKMLMILCAAFSGASTGGRSGHLAVTCSALAGNLALALAVVCWPPSEHRTIQRLRLAIYCTAAWMAATAVLSVLACSRKPSVGFEIEPLSAVNYYSCHPSNVAQVVGLLIALAVSYHALESITGLPPFARIARGVRPRSVRATRIFPASAPARQPIKHGTWLGKLMGSLDASASAVAAVAHASSVERRPLPD